MASQLYNEAPTLQQGAGPAAAQPKKIKPVPVANGEASPTAPPAQQPRLQGALGAVAQAAPTFAQLQQQGRARPAPPPPPVAQAPQPVATPAAQPSQPAASPPTYQAPTSPPAGNVRSTLEQSILSQLANPAGFGQQEVQDWYNRSSQDIDDQFAMQRTAAEEEMARRGLSASSIMGGRLADLNVQKRSAQIDLADKLGRQLAEELSNARNAANQTGIDYDRTRTQAESDALDRALGYDKLSLDSDLGHEKNDLERLGLTQDQSQFDKTLTQRQSEFDRGYDLDTQKFGEERRQFDQNYGLDERKLGEDTRQFDESMGYNRDRFDWQKQVDMASILESLGITNPDMTPEAESGYYSDQFPGYNPMDYFYG